MTCLSVVSKKMGGENNLKLVLNLKYYDDIEKDYFTNTVFYSMDCLTDIIKKYLAEHPEMNEYPRLYAKAVFSYPKFNNISFTATNWLSGEKDKSRIAQDLTEYLSDRILDDFRNELYNAKYITYFDYISEKYSYSVGNIRFTNSAKIYRNVIERAMADGRITIYLKNRKKSFSPAYKNYSDCDKDAIRISF